MPTTSKAYAYYHWQENGQKKTKYIQQRLLGDIQQASAAKCPVVEILALLGVTVSPRKLLGDNEINPSKQASQINPSNEISPSKMQRYKGEGSGSIH